MDDLSRQIAGLDTDVLTLAQRVDRIDNMLAVQEASRLEARLSPGSVSQAGARAGGLAIPSEIASGAPIMERYRGGGDDYTSGRIDPFFGRANMLRDPTMEQFYHTTLVGAALTPVGTWWEAIRTFGGAGTPSAFVAGLNDDRGTGASQRSSALVGITVEWGADTALPVTAQVILQPSNDSSVPVTPWTVASVRVAWVADEFTADDVRGTFRLAIVNNLGNEVASSEPVVIEDGEVGGDYTEVLIDTAYEAGGLLRPQIIVDLEADAITGSPVQFSLLISELQLHSSDTEDPASYTPAIGSWTPRKIEHVAYDLELPFIETYGLEGAILMEVYPDGRVQTYDSAGDPLGSFPHSLVLNAAIDNNDASVGVDWLPEFPVVNGYHYGLNIFGTYTAAHISQGLQIGFLHGGGRIAGVWQIFGGTGVSATTSDNDAVNSTSTSSTYTATAQTDAAGSTTLRMFRFQGTFSPTTDGTLRFRFRRGGANTTNPGITIRPGSTAIITRSGL